MDESVLRVLQESKYAQPLHYILFKNLGITATIVKAEAKGGIHDSNSAKLTALRYLFDRTFIDVEVSTVEQTKTLIYIRYQRLGVLIRQQLDQQIANVRYAYETQPANEYTRQLLTAYKKIYDILYFQNIDTCIVPTGET